MSFFTRMKNGLLAGLGAALAHPSELQAVTYGPSQSLSNMSRDDQVFLRSIGWMGSSSKAGLVITEFTAPNLTGVYGCINRISNPISIFPLKIFRTNDAGDAEEVSDHPLSKKIGIRPNDLMSSRTLRKAVQGHALLWGNGYCEIERNGRGQAIGLWPLMPWVTKPVYEDGRLQYRTEINNRQVKIDYDDVIHIMDQSQDCYVGESPIRRSVNALGLAAAAEEFGSKFFANDAKSGGFLMHPGRLGEGAKTNVKQSIEQESGLDYAHKVRVLEEGMKWVPTTIPPEDAQFLGTRLMQLAEIARIYDVPLIMLQSHDGVPSWGTGIEELMNGFVRQTLQPWVTAWEQEFDWKLFTEEERDGRGLYVKFNMNALLRGNVASRAAFYQAVFGVGGFSPNQILALEEMEGIGPDGDHHFVPANFQTIENAVKAAQPTQPQATLQ